MKIKNFNLSLFKKLVYESLDTNKQLMLEIDSDFIRSLSISSSNTLLKIAYARFEHFGETEEFFKFNMFVFEGSNFKKYLELYSELEETDITFTIMNDPNPENSNKLVATKIQLDGVTANKTKLSTIFTLTSSELMSSVSDDYQKVIEKLAYDKNINSEFFITKGDYSELKTLTSTLHNTISTNHSFLEFNISEVGINVKDKVFDITFGADKIINRHEDINFKMMKSDFIILNKHNWRIATAQQDDKLILLTKMAPIEDAKKHQEIIIGCIINKTNNATKLSNDPEEYIADGEDDFNIDLSDYDDI